MARFPTRPVPPCNASIPPRPTRCTTPPPRGGWNTAPPPLCPPPHPDAARRAGCGPAGTRPGPTCTHHMDCLRPWQQRRRRAGSRHAAAPGRHARGGDLAGRPRDSTCRRPPVLAARAGRGRGLQSAGPPSAGTAGFVHRRLAGHRPGAGRPAPTPLRTTDGAAACAAPQPGARAVRGRPFGPAGRHRAICPRPCAHAWRCAPPPRATP
jgi:hypothetical protein